MPQKSVSSFESDVAEIINLGKLWGMSNKDIQECLDIASKDYCDYNYSSQSHYDEISHEEDAKLNSLSIVLRASDWVLWLLKWLLVVGFVTIAAIILLYTTLMICTAVSPEFEQAVAKSAAEYIYPAMRFARIILKPVADRFDLSGIYSAECLLENPFFVDPVDDCGACQQTSKVADMTGQPVKKMQRHVMEMRPFVIRKYAKSAITLADLQKMFFENESKFKLGGTRVFSTNLDYVYNISDFFYKYNHEDFVNAKRGVGYVVWDTNSVPSSQAIRKLFPRPKFVDDSAEVSLMKKIFIEGPLAGVHELPVGGFVNNWYQQALGSRRVMLVPHPDCTEQCKSIQVETKAGDIVYYQDQYWRLLSEPLVNSDGRSTDNDISIAFSGGFTI